MLDLDKMRKLREKAALSQADAAERADMKGRQAWYNIESGLQPNVTLETLGKIARALKVDPAELLIKPKANKGK